MATTDSTAVNADFSTKPSSPPLLSKLDDLSSETLLGDKTKICHGRVANLETLVPRQWWKTVFADDLYLRTDGDVVEDPEITREEIRVLEQNPGVLEIFRRGGDDATQNGSNGVVSSSTESSDSMSYADSDNLSSNFSKDEPYTPARVLDLCCGQGRHALQLARDYPHLLIHGHDQSSYLISLAKDRAAAAGLTVNPTFTVGDCRNVPYPDDYFQLIMVMGNSFGYFDADSGDRAVLDEISRVLAPGGHVVLDLADGGYLRENFAERSWEWVDDTTFVCRERSLSRDAKRLLSREVVTMTEKGVVRDQFYQERLYSRSEITDLLEIAGLLDVAKLNDGGYGTHALLRYAASHGSSSSCSSNETDASTPPTKPSPNEVVTAAKDMSKRQEDLGMMAQRMFIFGMKPTRMISSEAGDDAGELAESVPEPTQGRSRNIRSRRSDRPANRVTRPSGHSSDASNSDTDDEMDPNVKHTQSNLNTSYSAHQHTHASQHSPLQNGYSTRVSTTSAPTQSIANELSEKLVISNSRESRPPPAFPAPFMILLGDPRLPCPGKLNDTWNPEDYDTRNRLIEAIVAMGYSRSDFEVLDDHSSLVADLCARKPGFVFNLCDEGYQNDALKELHVAALLEMLDVKYSGAGPVCLGVCFDKALVNRTASSLGVPVPRETYYLAENASTRPLIDPSAIPDCYDPCTTSMGPPLKSAAVHPEDDISALTTAIATEIGYPCFIKPMRGDNSIGITVRSIVRTPEQTAEYIRELRAMGINDIIVQEYLEGEEFGVGVIGNLVQQDGTGLEGSGLKFLPTMKVDFTRIMELKLPPILGFESKWDPTSPYWTDIRYVPACLPPHEEANLRSWCAVLFERFGCRDYARFDFRADKQGCIKLLEVNPNPGWCWDGKLAHMAEFEEMSYPDVLRDVLEAAHKRVFPDGVTSSVE